MTYPVVSLVMVLGITAFLMIGIVPKFQEVFDSLDIALPGLTQVVLGISLWLAANWHLVGAGGIGSSCSIGMARGFAFITKCLSADAFLGRVLRMGRYG